MCEWWVRNIRLSCESKTFFIASLVDIKLQNRVQYSLHSVCRWVHLWLWSLQQMTGHAVKTVHKVHIWRFLQLCRVFRCSGMWHCCCVSGSHCCIWMWCLHLKWAFLACTELLCVWLVVYSFTTLQLLLNGGGRHTCSPSPHSCFGSLAVHC